MQFRSDINALRAIAVMSVVLYHFKFPGGGGGFMGVDLFFVISGYLMTRIVVPELPRGSFSHLARAVRIWPALATMVLALLLAGVVAMPPMDFQALGQQAVAALTFTSNQYYRDSANGYFITGPDERWLLHTWSLAVEWQFYMLYPLLLMGAYKIAGRLYKAPAIALGGGAMLGVFAMVWGLLLASLAASIFETGSNPAHAFFSLSPRVWEMAAGGLVCLHEPWLAAWFGQRRGKWVQTAAALFALMIMSAGAKWHWEAHWPGMLALAPVLAGVVFLAAGSSRADPHPWVNFKPLQHVGLWSYSIYLWHWPLAVLAEMTGWADQHKRLVMLSGVLLSIALGALSYLWVEKRIVFKRARNWRQPSVAWALGGLLSAIVVGFLVDCTDGWFARAGSDAAWYQSIIDAKTLAKSYPSGCVLEEQNAPEFSTCTLNAGRQNTKVMVYGDSHAKHLFPWFQAHAQAETAFWARGGCPPVQGLSRLDHPEFRCDVVAALAQQRAKDADIAVVIMAGNWGAFDSPQQFCFAKEGRCVEGLPTPDRAFAIRQSQAFISELLSLGKRVVLVRQSPFVPLDVGQEAMRRRWLGLETLKAAKPRFKTSVDTDIAAPFHHSPGFAVVNFWPTLCPEDLCQLMGRDGLPIFYDASHLMPDWIKAHGTAFAPFASLPPVERPTSNP